MNTTSQADTRVKAVMDWGYRHGLFLTQSQADDLLKAIAGDPTTLHGLPKGKYDGQPEHAERGFQPK